jgi:hypothetical protein
MFTQLCEEVPKDMQRLEFQFRGHVIKDSEKQGSEAQGACATFCQGLLTYMKSRFTDGGADVLSAMCGVFDPAVVASVEKERFESCLEKLHYYRASPLSSCRTTQMCLSTHNA